MKYTEVHCFRVDQCKDEGVKMVVNLCIIQTGIIGMRVKVNLVSSLPTSHHHYSTSLSVLSLYDTCPVSSCEALTNALIMAATINFLT